MNRSIHWYDYITHNIYWTGLTSLSQATTPLIIPILVQKFVGDYEQATYFGILRLWTLMVAILFQAVMGMFSDHNRSAWGRRRPFIVIGNTGIIIALILIGFSTNLEGIKGYWILFTITIFLMIAANTAHSATQGIIPDLVPEKYRGRFSGYKALFEVPIPVIIVSLTIGKVISKGNIWGGIIILIAILTITMTISLFIPERKYTELRSSLKWQPVIRLFLMTVFFTLTIILMQNLVNIYIRNVIFSNYLINMVMIGFVGLLAMFISALVGVSISMRIGLGKTYQEHKSYKWWVINRLTFLIGSTNLGSFFIYYLQNRLGYQNEEAAGPASKLLMFVGVFILVAALPGGFLVDKFGSKKFVAFSGLFAGIGTFIVLIAPNLNIIYVGGCIIGTAIGLFYTSNWALGTSIIPDLEAGKYFGISNLAGAGAGAIGAYIGGPIADYITQINHHANGIGYIVLFSIYGILFLASVLSIKKITI